MPRLSANLSFLFTEVPFLERFGAAARAGFAGVEFGFAYDVPVAEIAARLSEHALACVLINAPPGRLDQGERGIASLPGVKPSSRRASPKRCAMRTRWAARACT
jgi:hydroxypyruvate isomerase